MDSTISPSSSQSPSRTWHKQSGSRAATDGPLALRGKDLIDRTNSPATMSTLRPNDSDLSTNAKKSKSPFKANVKVKRSQPTTRVPAPALNSTSGSGSASISTSTVKPAKTKTSTTIQPTGVVKKRKSKSRKKPSSVNPPPALVKQTPFTAPAPTLSAQPFTQVPKPRALPVESDDSDKNMTSLARFRKEMLGRHRRRDMVGDVGRTGRVPFVTVKK